MNSIILDYIKFNFYEETMKQTQKKTYRFREGPFKNRDAKKIGKYLEQLHEENNKHLTPDVLVEYASNPDSPIHEYFDWNNKSAAKKYRLQQARLILNSLKVQIISYTNGKITSRVEINEFTNIKSPDEKQLVYRITTEAMENQYERDYILRNAIREISIWRMKYERLKELSEIINVVKIYERKLG